MKSVKTNICSSFSKLQIGGMWCGDHPRPTMCLNNTYVKYLLKKRRDAATCSENPIFLDSITNRWTKFCNLGFRHYLHKLHQTERQSLNLQSKSTYSLRAINYLLFLEDFFYWPSHPHAHFTRPEFKWLKTSWKCGSSAPAVPSKVNRLFCNQLNGEGTKTRKAGKGDSGYRVASMG